MTSQEPKTQHHVDEYAPDTEVIAVPEPAPVFVDSTGRRSRLLRRLALGFGILLVAYGGLISVSLAGGPVSSSAVLPLPGLDDDDEDEKPKAGPVPTPEPTPTPSTARRAVESAPREETDQRRPSATVSPKTSAKPSKSPAPKPSPSKAPASPSVTKPLESATVTQAPTPGPASSTPIAPVPPKVQPPGGGTGGSGGGGPVPEPTTTSSGELPAAATDTPVPPLPPLPPVHEDPVDRAMPPTRAAP